MKAWVYLLYEMFDEKYYTYEQYLQMPEKTKRAMLKQLKEEKFSVKQALRCLPPIEAAKIRVSTLEELFEIDVRGFDAKVIKGQSKAIGQIGLEEIIKFKPKVVKEIK